MFAQSFTFYEILAVEICMALSLTFRIGQGQMEIYQSKSNRGLPNVLAIAIFALFVTVSEIFTVEMCMTLTLTFIVFQGQM